jgi:DNA polymerase-3 subunit beta
MTATATKPKASSTTLKIPRAELLRAVTAASKAVPSRHAKPILQNIRIGDGLVTATDLEVRIDVQIAGMCEPFLVPADRLASILRESKSEDVSLKKSGASVVVKCGTSEWTLPTEDVAEFPAAGDFSAKSVVHLPGTQFVSLMNAVRFAPDSESSRYALGGVLIEFVDGRLSFVATDGRRMCVAECGVDVATDDFVNQPKPGSSQKKAPIVPRRVVDILCGMAKTDDSIQIDADERVIVAEFDGCTVTANLIDGRFPKWRDVEPERKIKPSTVLVGELLSACRQAAICTSEQSKGVKFDFTDDGLRLSSQSSEAGKAECDCVVLEVGASCSVSLDPRFITEWLACGSFDELETIRMEAESPTAAVVLAAGDCRCVVMPLDPTA